MVFEFNQRQYMNDVFMFIYENDMTIREFCKLTGVAAATLYRARDTKSPMDLRTIRKLDGAMKKHIRSLV